MTLGKNNQQNNAIIQSNKTCGKKRTTKQFQFKIFDQYHFSIGVDVKNESSQTTFSIFPNKKRILLFEKILPCNILRRKTAKVKQKITLEKKIRKKTNHIHE